jgi:Transglutaminase-like superfamily
VALLVRPAPLPQGRAGPVDRVRLAAEILVAYAELLRLVRRNDLGAMVACARRTWVEPLPAPPDDEAHLVALRMGRMVHRVVSRLPTDKRCLINALVLVRLMAHRSIPCRLVIGVQSDGRFAAHAWVEHRERPVLPSGAFARLVEL